MTSTETTPGSVAAAAARLQTELPLLEKQQQALELELVSVTKRLESARTALDALLAHCATYPSTTPMPTVDEESTGLDQQTSNRDAVDRGARPHSIGPEEPTSADSSAPNDQSNGVEKISAVDDHAPATVPHQAALEINDGAGLTEQVLKVLSMSGNRPVRARDIAQALGRDATSGSINAVRSTLDRLVATSRAHRAGRGLYQTPVS
ncbi:hypothetical protein ABZY19_37510 [Streptomyces sp. NPDC006475]|uniref:hypothetical protein n=1 Tax=Streptomyces sp. NPDC006475 TaxID=3155719 RepID=UPI0033A9BBC3